MDYPVCPIPEEAMKEKEERSVGATGHDEASPRFHRHQHFARYKQLGC